MNDPLPVDRPLRLPDPSLVVLVGATGSGKTVWARRFLGADRIVSSDALRGVVGLSEHDQRAGGDAFEVLDLVVDRRLHRRLATVVDSTGLDAKRRAAWLGLARRHGVPAHAVLVDAPEKVCKERNRKRARPVPDPVLKGQLAAAAAVLPALEAEGWDGVHRATAAGALLVPAHFLGGPRRPDLPPLAFGLHLSRFPSDAAAVPAWLGAVADAAEAGGFTSLWVMDHLVQIPQVGREWDAILEPYATLAWLAARTRTLRLGVLVGSATVRHPAVVAKAIATLDVLSAGRAWCGLGAGWYEHEHRSLGLPFATPAERLDALEDALQALPLFWGSGSPRFVGKTISIEAATCYPRPVQERVPVLVGGQGERQTLRLVARYADAANLFGPPDVVAHKLAVLRRHCEAEGRDPATIRVTHLSRAGVVSDPADRPTPDDGTVDEQVDRFAALADAGVAEAIVAVNGAEDADAGPAAVERFAAIARSFPP